MGLRSEAAAALVEIYEDEDTGGGWPITVVSPAGLSKVVIGRSADIGQMVDLETGAILSGRSASVSFAISSILTAGFTTLPEGVVTATQKPWLVNFKDANGNSHTFKIQQSNPDRTVGAVTCILEVYKS